MSARRIVAMVLVLSVLGSGPGLVSPTGAQPAPVVAPPPPAEAQAPTPSADVTPARVSYSNGEVSFWRPGAQDWTQATLNTPLAPGDVLYAGRGGNVEIQVGPLAFVRATNGTQIGLDNQEPGFVQLRVTGGEAAVDVRQLPPGSIIEVDTPNAAFTIDRAGYYRAGVAQDSTTFTIHRGGSATMTPAGGAAAPIGADQQVVLTGMDSPQVAIGAAPQLTAWDNWNYQRTDYLLRPASARYVSSGVYGAEALDQHGSWRTVESYGAVWVPAGVPADWVPYSTGRWIWDPRFGWTWLDDAPWGWAPYHYGRWVFVGSYWAWAPGPVIVRPVYAPALVVFLGGVSVGVGIRPLCWAPLGWGEPVIPWWGRPGFIGVASWRGWGGPRVVNNVVINQHTTVNVTNITVYRNVNVTNAVVGVPAEKFGQGHVKVARIREAEVRQLKPVRGALEAKPVAASVMPATGPAVKPPATIQSRPVVATRPPHDVAKALEAHGLAGTAGSAPAPRLVPAPERVAVPSVPREPRPGREPAPKVSPGNAGPAGRGSEERRGMVERPIPAAPRGSPQIPAPANAPGIEERKRSPVERATPPPPPGAPQMAPPHANAPGMEERKRPPAERGTPPPPPGAPRMAPPSQPNAPGPEERKRNPVERATPPPPAGAPPMAPPPQPNAPGPEERRRNPVERVTPPPPAGPRQVAPLSQPNAASLEERKRHAAQRVTPTVPPGFSPMAPVPHPAPGSPALPSVSAPSTAPPRPASPGPTARFESRPSRAAPPGPADRPPRMEPPGRGEQPERGESRAHSERRESR
jgi:hypothetical protein